MHATQDEALEGSTVDRTEEDNCKQTCSSARSCGDEGSSAMFRLLIGIKTIITLPSVAFFGVVQSL